MSKVSNRQRKKRSERKKAEKYQEKCRDIFQFPRFVKIIFQYYGNEKEIDKLYVELCADDSKEALNAVRFFHQQFPEFLKLNNLLNAMHGSIGIINKRHIISKVGDEYIVNGITRYTHYEAVQERERSLIRTKCSIYNGFTELRKAIRDVAKGVRGANPAHYVPIMEYHSKLGLFCPEACKFCCKK